MAIISLISALAKNRVIGIENRLPWTLPADWENFRRVTAGRPFLMGRKSYEAKDALISSDRNFILTRNPALDLCENCERVGSVEAAIGATGDAEELFILGGASVFAMTLNMAQKMYLTEVNAEVHGDAWFPEIAWADWERIESEYYPKDERHAYDFHINTYIRKI